MIKGAATALSIVALATLATPVLGEDDFPLVGTYTENQVCKGDGSDSGVSRVKITGRDIDSVFGLCTCLLYTSPSPRDGLLSRMPSSA